jgi:O-antigen/teichoic acid export membrane protein
MHAGFFKNISASTFQFVVNQLAALLVFYVLSSALDKEAFGQLNWALAVLLLASNLLALGLDQLALHKTAAGVDPALFFPAYLAHCTLAAVIFYALLMVMRWLFPTFYATHHLLTWIGIGKMLLFVVTPFKQLAAGREQFGLLFRMSVISGLSKAVVLSLLAFTGYLTVPLVVIVFAGSDALECAATVWLGRRLVPPRTGLFNRKRKSYKQLLAEAWPLLGVAVCTSAMARFDWVFIGFFRPARLAEYSFATKAFEVSSLPLLVIAPVLIPAFTRKFGQPWQPPGTTMQSLRTVVRLEMIIAGFTGMLLCGIWPLLADRLSSGKYGSVNLPVILVLAAMLPWLYLSNFFWTILFARGQNKPIFRVILISCLVNITGDLLLIPFTGNTGAAAAWLLSVVTQVVLYGRRLPAAEVRYAWKQALLSVASAGAGLVAVFFTPLAWYAALPLGCLLYLLVQATFTPGNRISEQVNIPIHELQGLDR